MGEGLGKQRDPSVVSLVLTPQNETSGNASPQGMDASAQSWGPPEARGGGCRDLASPGDPLGLQKTRQTLPVPPAVQGHTALPSPSEPLPGTR